MKKVRFYIRWPGGFYAEGPIALLSEGTEGVPLTHKTSERNVRAAVRAWFDLDRLPNGFEVWSTDD